MTSTTAPEMTRIEDGVLQITIATSAAGATLDFNGVDQGIKALQSLDSSVGAILLVGSGDNFCTGGNVHAFASAPERGAYVRDVAGRLHNFVRALRGAPAPVVAGVQGWATGAGMSLVCASDISIGGPSTKLRPAYPGIGFTPDGGLSWTLPRIVGISRAREILLTNATLSGDEAVRLGILGRLVGDEVVVDEALRVARTLAAGPTSAHAGIKKLLADSITSTLSDHLDAETDSISAAADSAAGREGVDAFVEKRRPQFGDIAPE